MYLKLHGVELFNFKSYRGAHSFNAPTMPGLYYLTGKNLVNPRLGANGCGKSSLLDAFFWCLYGKTLRGLRGNEIISHEEATSRVTVHLSIGDESFAIFRSQSPNNLTINKRPVDQSAVNKLLRLTPDQFTYAVMFPQFGTPFLDRTPTEKLELFSKILELDYWLDKSKQAQVSADELQQAIIVQDKVAARNEGYHQALEAELPRLKAKQAEYNDVRRIIAGLKVKLQAATWKLAVATQKQQEANKIKALAQYEVAQTTQTIENIGSLKGVCPTCLQTVSAAHLRAEKTRLVGHLKQLKTHERQVLARYEAAAMEVSKLTRDVAGITQNVNDFSQRQAQAEQYATAISEKQAEMKALELAIGKADEKLEALTRDHTATEFWVGGFKRLRLFVVEQVLQQLELEVNNNLVSLGLPDWRINFDVERENKSGGITKGFVVLVSPPSLGEPVRLEAWSGGEYQRLQLAGQLGLANLIMERAGLTNTIEFYDEPSAHLSVEGVADLAETLAQRADDTGRVIVLCDHTTIETGNFAGVITCIKDEKGSRVTTLQADT